MMMARLIPVNEYLYIGCNLGLGSQEVKRIYQQNHANNINVIPEILLAWRDKRVRATDGEKLKELITALQNLELNTVADKITDLYNQRK